ncbi:SAM-dependent methyltransferase [Granulicella arctica]|uniref:SAM-dependent methyltransferase n=1 Tax=Granulicella arctica TaxID=940613 RepID=UPI0021E0A446|nr:SAM-dependent methyltransferase [Granulicella arctica]
MSDLQQNGSSTVATTFPLREAQTIQVRPRVNDANGHASKSTGKLQQKATDLLAAAQQFADEVAARPNGGEVAAPLADLQSMAELGLLVAPLPLAYGGLGLGTEAGGHLILLRILAAIGGADLVLGRLYEGHANGLILVATFGTPQQIATAAQDARNGLLFGVWNTGAKELLRLEGGPSDYIFRGVKNFASGAMFVKRPIVTAEREGLGWQMTIPRMESTKVAGSVQFDPGFWHPLGMEGSESYGVTFTGATVTTNDLIGKPGDFYREPLFRGGAIRFAAVHAGAVLRLHRMFAEWLEAGGRGGDPYQVARLGEVALGAQEAVLWIERAAAIAEDGLSLDADKLNCERMLECANMTRLAIERVATAMMQRVVAGVGAHGLLRPSRFERIVRDLTMYLRQPAPDQALADVGRASLRKTNLRSDGAGNGMWRGHRTEGSLPPAYFRQIYERSRDPWGFETSEYEAGKYAVTLESLPRERYETALEIGCSIGVLTKRLAPRCNSLLSLDVSERALAAARERCKGLSQVRFARMQVPHEMPEGLFDLIVVSEVAYYWQREDLERAASLLAERQAAGSHLVLVHFTAPVPDYPLTGDEVHDAWLARSEWVGVRQERRAGYRLDVLERRS